MKVVTVGLNPSLAEFPEAAPFSRFPDWSESLSSPEQVDTDDYLRSLDRYFQRNPYRRWFDPSYESVLRGATVSYYSESQPALHTDICSPLATNPTWTRLGADRKRLGAEGQSLWHDLVDELEPDVAIMSVAREHRDAVGFPTTEPERIIFTLERENPYEVTGQRVRLSGGKRMLLVFGRAANTPMGTVSSNDKQWIGEAILEALDER